MKIKYEFDTAAENFDRGELLRIQKANDMARALWDLSQAVRDWYRNKTDRPCNPDTLQDVFYTILGESNIDLDQLWS